MSARDDAVDRYLRGLARELPHFSSSRRRLLREVREHLREEEARGVSAGLDPEAARAAAIDRFGTPAQVAAALRVEIGRRPRGAAIAALGLGAATAAVLAAVLIARPDARPEAIAPSPPANERPPPAVDADASPARVEAPARLDVLPPALPPPAPPGGTVVPVAFSGPLAEDAMLVLREPQLVNPRALRRGVRLLPPGNRLFFPRARVALTGAGPRGRGRIVVVPSRRRNVHVFGSVFARVWRFAPSRLVTWTAGADDLTPGRRACDGRVVSWAAGVFPDQVRDVAAVFDGRVVPATLGQNGFWVGARRVVPELCTPLSSTAPPVRRFGPDALLVASEDGETLIVPIDCVPAGEPACPPAAELPDRWAWPEHVPGARVRLSPGALAVLERPATPAASRPDGETARLLVTAGSGARRQAVYAARSDDDTRLCLVALGGPAAAPRSSSGAICLGDRIGGQLIRLREAVQLFTAARGHPRRGRGWITIAGLARSEVRRVTVVLADRRELDLPVGRWRTFTFTAASPALLPVGVRAYAADGARIYERRLPWDTPCPDCPPPPPPGPAPAPPPVPAHGPPAPRPRVSPKPKPTRAPPQPPAPRPRPPVSSIPLSPRSQPLPARAVERLPTRPAAGETPTEHLRTRVGRRVVSLVTYHDATGRECRYIRIAGALGGSCRTELDPRPLLVEGPGAMSGGGSHRRWALLWLSGLASSRVQRLVVVSTDCSRRTVGIDTERNFLYIAAPDTLQKDIWPRRLLTYDRDGRLIAEKWLSVTRYPAPRADWPSRPRTPIRSCRSRDD